MIFIKPADLYRKAGNDFVFANEVAEQPCIVLEIQLQRITKLKETVSNTTDSVTGYKQLQT